MIIYFKIKLILFLLSKYKSKYDKYSKWYIWYISFSKSLLEEFRDRYLQGDKSVLVVVKNYIDELFPIVQYYNDIKMKGWYYGLFKILKIKSKNLAYLKDDILFKATGKQYYGTKFRFHIKHKFFQLYPVKGLKEFGTLTQLNIKMLNRRRKKVGLILFSRSIKEIEDNTNLVFNKKIYNL